MCIWFRSQLNSFISSSHAKSSIVRAAVSHPFHEWTYFSCTSPWCESGGCLSVITSPARLLQSLLDSFLPSCGERLLSSAQETRAVIFCIDKGRDIFPQRGGKSLLSITPISSRSTFSCKALKRRRGEFTDFLLGAPFSYLTLRTG